MDVRLTGKAAWPFRSTFEVREHDKNVVVAGLYNRLELWDADTWTRYTSKTEQASTDIASSLANWASSMAYHEPVMLAEVREAMQPRSAVL